MTVADTTEHAVIYHGLLLHNGLEPVAVSGWARILERGSESLEHDLIGHSMHQLISDRPDMNPGRLRMVEFSWTDMGPLEIPEVTPFVDLVKRDKGE